LPLTVCAPADASSLRRCAGYPLPEDEELTVRAEMRYSLDAADQQRFAKAQARGAVTPQVTPLTGAAARPAAGC
jgi:hypothetical protein